MAKWPLALRSALRIVGSALQAICRLIGRATGSRRAPVEPDVVVQPRGSLPLHREILEHPLQAGGLPQALREGLVLQLQPPVVPEGLPEARASACSAAIPWSGIHRTQ